MKKAKYFTILSCIIFLSSCDFGVNACYCKESLVGSPTYNAWGEPLHTQLQHTAPPACIEKYGDPDEDVDAWIRRVNSECND